MRVEDFAVLVHHPLERLRGLGDVLPQGDALLPVLPELRGQVQAGDLLAAEPRRAPGLLRGGPVQGGVEVGDVAQPQVHLGLAVVLDVVERPGDPRRGELADLLGRLPQRGGPRVLADVGVAAGHPPRAVRPLLEEEPLLAVLVAGAQQQPGQPGLVLCGGGFAQVAPAAAQPRRPPAQVRSGTPDARCRSRRQRRTARQAGCRRHPRRPCTGRTRSATGAGACA